MTKDQMYFRNDLAVDLVKIISGHTTQYEPETLTHYAFEIADCINTRINADEDALNAELAKKREAVRAANQAEFDALVGGLKVGPFDRRKADCDCSQLRRENDKVEVHELTPEQALDMIASLIFPPKH